MAVESKLHQVRIFLGHGNWYEALRIVKSFPRLPREEKAVIERAWAALQAPATYKEMGHDIKFLVVRGVDTLCALYRIPAKTTHLCLAKIARLSPSELEEYATSHGR